MKAPRWLRISAGLWFAMLVVAMFARSQALAVISVGGMFALWAVVVFIRLRDRFEAFHRFLNPDE
ncbi:MAG: hypothetical protein ACRERC_12300 [Candidatus Binatia bacterium]